MLTKLEVTAFTEQWLAAWNSHNLEEIMSHYDEAVELVSPVAAQLLQDPSGKVVGKVALRDYFRRGLEAFPNLKFTLKDMLWGINSIVLYYENHRGTCTGEYMEISQAGKIIRVVANYSG